MFAMQWSKPGENYDLAKAIRKEVFIDEQGFSPDTDIDATDAVAEHLVILENGVPVATGRIFSCGDQRMSMGRICVRKNWRGKNVGRLLTQELLARIRAKGARFVEIDSQEQAMGFYEKLGFTVCGDPHYDEHVLHRPMVLELTVG